MDFLCRTGVVAAIALACALTLHPLAGHAADSGEAEFAKGWDLLQKKQYQEARAALEGGMKKNPSNALAHFYLGDACRGLKDWPCAEEQYETSLDLDDKSSVAGLAKARLHKAKGWRLLNEAKSVMQDSQAKPETIKQAKDTLELANKLGLDDEQQAVYQQVREKSVQGQPGAVPTTSAGQQEVTGKDGAPMALVPAGEFLMGSNQGDDNEKPVHRVFLNAYYMDTYEVTVGRYAKFLDETGMEPPPDWKTMNQPQHQKRPVVYVDWADAVRYCRWAGKRLPTEAEWEKAARGTDGRTYPWGNDSPTGLQANFGKGVADKSQNYGWRDHFALSPVGALEDGKSPYGIYDMAGNVWEWTSDWYDESYYQNSPAQNPKGPASGEYKVLRGGSFYFFIPQTLRSASRYLHQPPYRNPYNGFRCAKTP